MKSKSLKKLNLFVRYGGVNAVRQDGYLPKGHEGDAFHKPPARHGIYAFPISGIETFLCGHRMNRPKTEEGDVYVKEIRDCKFWIYISSKRISEATDLSTLEYYTTELDKNIKMLNECEKHFRQAASERKKAGHKKKFHQKLSKFEYDGPIWHHLELPPSLVKAIKKKKNKWILTSFKVYERALRIRLSSQWKNYAKDDMEVFIENI